MSYKVSGGNEPQGVDIDAGHGGDAMQEFGVTTV